MPSLRLPGVLLMAALVVAACGSSGSPAPSSASSAAASVVASAAASAAPSGSGASAASCSKVSGSSGDVAATIKSFKFSPDPIQLKVGQAVAWTNQDSIGHSATLDDGSCDTGVLDNLAVGVLRFDSAGTFAYHCKIHPTMTGKIEVTG